MLFSYDWKKPFKKTGLDFVDQIEEVSFSTSVARRFLTLSYAMLKTYMANLEKDKGVWFHKKSFKMAKKQMAHMDEKQIHAIYKLIISYQLSSILVYHVKLDERKLEDVIRWKLFEEHIFQALQYNLKEIDTYMRMKKELKTKGFDYSTVYYRMVTEKLGFTNTSANKFFVIKTQEINSVWYHDSFLPAFTEMYHKYST